MKYDSESQVQKNFTAYCDKMLSEVKSEVVNFACLANKCRKRFHSVEALDLSNFYCTLRISFSTAIH